MNLQIPPQQSIYEAFVSEEALTINLYGLYHWFWALTDQKNNLS